MKHLSRYVIPQLFDSAVMINSSYIEDIAMGEILDDFEEEFGDEYRPLMPGTIEFTGQYRMTFTGTYDRVQICWDRNGNYLGGDR